MEVKQTLSKSMSLCILVLVNFYYNTSILSDSYLIHQHVSHYFCNKVHCFIVINLGVLYYVGKKIKSC